jgi:hypothetical protein
MRRTLQVILREVRSACGPIIPTQSLQYSEARQEKMKSSQEWRDTALRLRAWSDEYERRAEALEHPLNLLLNNRLIAFHTAMTEDGTIHEFLFGVASNVPTSHSFRRAISGEAIADFPVALWRTRFEPHGV